VLWYHGHYGEALLGYTWAEDKEHCEENGRMLQANPSKVSQRAKKRGLPQVNAHIHVLAHTYMHTWAHTCMCMHTCAHTCVCTHTCAHTHTLISHLAQLLLVQLVMYTWLTVYT